MIPDFFLKLGNKMEVDKAITRVGGFPLFLSQQIKWCHYKTGLDA